MKKSRSISKLIVAVFGISIFVVIFPPVIYAAQGITITLENTGQAPITEPFLGFDLKPLDPGQTMDVTVGGGLEPSNIGDFQIGVMPISDDNPLLPGETACVGPLSELTSGDYVEAAQVTLSFGDSFILGDPSVGFPELKLKPRVTTLPIYLGDTGIPGGPRAGVFRFLSTVPNSCKKAYAPPFGKMSINSDALVTTSTSVDLSLICYPTVGYTCQEMQFSNDNINWSAPEPYTRNKTWTLLPGDGEKTVYIKFKDNTENWSNVYNDTIILSTRTLQQIRSFPIPAFPDPGINLTALAFGGGKLFAKNSFYDPSTESYKAKIYVLDPANGNILNSFPAPQDGLDLTSDGVNLYLSTYTLAPVTGYIIMGDIMKLDSTNGSVLATIHPSGVSTDGGIFTALTFLNGEIFKAGLTENCTGISLVRLNKEDGSFLGCFSADSLGIFPSELDSDGTNLLYGAWVKENHSYADTYDWTVFTVSPNGSLLKADVIVSNQAVHSNNRVLEAWGDNQLFVADRQSNQIIDLRFPSSGIVVPASINFGEVLAGTISTPQTVTISNTGSANLVINSLVVTGADAGMFSAAMGGPNPCSSLTPTVALGQNCTVNVTFSPTSTLKKAAVLSISSDDFDGNPVNVPLSGTGIDMVTVSTPNGGEIISSGSTYALQWGAPSDAVKFDLKYSINNGTTWKTIARKVSGTRYDWLVPAPLNNQTTGLIKVTGFDSSGRKVGEDISDSPFNIEAVKLISPGRGDTLASGNTRTITWRTNGTMKPVASVKLFYSINGGYSWKDITTVKGDPGSYDWAAPNVSSTGCKVKVVLKDAGGATVGDAVSGGLFTIWP
jgi:hypothetical protein